VDLVAQPAVRYCVTKRSIRERDFRKDRLGAELDCSVLLQAALQAGEFRRRGDRSGITLVPRWISQGGGGALPVEEPRALAAVFLIPLVFAGAVCW